ncbi:MAG: dynamin [Actinophytocola sp.]|nr:dynamin [Actinophytocola sp.]
MTSPFFAKPVKDALPAQLEQLRESLTSTLRELDPGAVNWLETARKARPAKPSVVVVGETKRGKSTLINALLNSPGLSPVDAEVATATYLVFDHADSWQAQACYPGRPAVPFEMDELVNWTSAKHELPAGQLPPRYVEVSGPCPLLERVSIVDTPGVGGLDSMHGELAIEAASAATALLFVVDASAPLTAGELSFLRKMSDQVETVRFVLSKTDAFRGWRQILEANQQLLAEHAPRFAGAEFHPVAARMFEMAADAPSDKAAAMLREKSGIIGLQIAMQELLIGKAAILSEANNLRALITAFGEQDSKLRAERRALNSGESEADALRERRDQLNAERKSSTRGWQLKLRSEVQRARVDCNHEVARQMRDVQSWFRQQIDSADKDKLDTLPAEVDNALHVVSGRLTATLGQRLNEATDSALAELFTAEELRVIRAQFARSDGPQIIIRAPERKPSTAEDKLMVGMGTYMGIGASNMGLMSLTGMSIATAGLVAAPVLAVGLGAGWWIGRTRKHAANKQHIKQWLTESIAEARSTMDQLVAEQIIEAEHQLTLALDEALTRRIDAIEAELKEVDKTLKMSAAEKSKKLGIVGNRLKEVTASLQRAESMLGKVTARAGKSYSADGY